MEPLIAELKQQYHSTFTMYQSLLEGCSEEIGQHHVGKLTAYLNLEGVQLNHWKG